MRAIVVATTTPHNVYADGSGAFALPNIEPGQYTLRVAAQGRVTERIVEIAAGRVDLGDVRAGS
jgi:hypothetical protein